jgi:hypothetical protein
LFSSGYCDQFSERAKLEQEVHALTAGVLQEESRFHYLNSHSQIKQAQLDKGKLEI